MQQGSTGRRLLTWMVACGAAVGTVLAVGCAPHPGDPRGTISGIIVQVGGPVSERTGEPRSVSIDAVAAVYRRGGGQTSVAGKPIVQAATRPRGSGRFKVAVAPGEYLVVAESHKGDIISTPQPVDVTAGGNVSIHLRVIVP